MFCYAPRAALRKYAMETFKVGADEADKIVAEQNKQREQYVRRHWNRNWLAHENYHLCLNTAWLGLDGAAIASWWDRARQFGAAAADAPPTDAVARDSDVAQRRFRRSKAKYE